jgi:hypothetical protein
MAGSRIAAADATLPGRARGVELIDPQRGTRRLLERRAGNVRMTAGTLLLSDGDIRERPGFGLKGFTLNGRPRFHVLKNEAVWQVLTNGRFAYARTNRGLRVVDVRLGKVVARSAGNRNLMGFF